VCEELVHTRAFDIVLEKMIVTMPEYSISRFMYDPIRKKVVYLRPGRVVWDECRFDNLICDVEHAVLDTFRSYCKSVGCDTSRYLTKTELAERMQNPVPLQVTGVSSSAALMDRLNGSVDADITVETPESDSRKMLTVWNTLMIKGRLKCKSILKTIVDIDDLAMHAVCKKRKEGWFLARSVDGKPDRFVRIEKKEMLPLVAVVDVKDTDYAMETIRTHVDADAALLLNDPADEMPTEFQKIYSDAKLIEEWVYDSWATERRDVCRYSIARRAFAECFPEKSSKEKVVHVEVCSADAGKDMISNAFGHTFSPKNPNVLKENELYQGGNFLDVNMVRKMSYNGAVVHNDTDFHKIPDDVIRVRFGNSTDSGERDAYGDEPHRRSDDFTLFCSCNHHLYRKYADDTQDKIRVIFDVEYNPDGSIARRIRKRFVSQRQEGDDEMIVQLDNVTEKFRALVPHKPSEIDFRGEWEYASAFALFTFKVLMDLMRVDIDWMPKRNYPAFCQEQLRRRVDPGGETHTGTVTRITRTDPNSLDYYMNMGREETIKSLVKDVFNSTEKRKGRFITPSDVVNAIKAVARPLQWAVVSMSGVGYGSHTLKTVMNEYAILHGGEWLHNTSAKQTIPGSKQSVKGHYIPGLCIGKFETDTAPTARIRPPG